MASGTCNLVLSPGESDWSRWNTRSSKRLLRLSDCGSASLVTALLAGLALLGDLRPEQIDAVG
jgi:hypothetical protein